ncbi:hypothetical protein RJ640_029031 [Escallonia rubra]|uniref:Uncharacterized protein n=1 Tax=Escallonia rubra TaxID=112253 RepID=A0AA88US31_9ASTE|nr:hypothetical protein RJ640_029031 [Escallonia rubra]
MKSGREFSGWGHAQALVDKFHPFRILVGLTEIGLEKAYFSRKNAEAFGLKRLFNICMRLKHELRFLDEIRVDLRAAVSHATVVVTGESLLGKKGFLDAQRELLENPVLLVVRIWLKEAPEPRLESIYLRWNSWHMLLAALPPLECHHPTVTRGLMDSRVIQRYEVTRAKRKVSALVQMVSGPFCVRDWPDSFSIQEALDFFFHLCCDLRPCWPLRKLMILQRALDPLWLESIKAFVVGESEVGSKEMALPLLQRLTSVERMIHSDRHESPTPLHCQNPCEISRMPPEFFDEMNKIFEAGEKEFLSMAKGGQKEGPSESLSELSESQFATSKAIAVSIGASTLAVILTLTAATLRMSAS